MTYVLNGGIYNGSTNDIIESYSDGTVISIHEAPTREWYRFTYWKGSEYQPGDQYTVEGDHTFTAQWNMVTGTDSNNSNSNATIEKTTEAPKNTNPSGNKTVNTGDETNLILFIILLLVSLTGICIIIKMRNNDNV